MTHTHGAHRSECFYFANGENLEGKGGQDVGSMPIPVPLESSESE